MATLKWDIKKEEWVPIVAVPEVKKVLPVKNQERVLPATKSEKVTLYDPKYLFVQKLTRHLYQENSVKLIEPAFRNRKISAHSKGQLIFGYESINRAYDKGFFEYNCLISVWAKYGHKVGGNSYLSSAAGYVGLWMLVIHEFAHVLQFHSGGHRKGIVHDNNYTQILDNLISRFPYAKMLVLR